MAEGKNSFVLYRDHKELFEEITDEQAGKLIKHIYRFVSDEDPAAPDEMTKLLFIPIKQSLKRDLKKWENKQKQRAEAGRLGGIARAEKAKQEQANQATAKNSKRSQANQAVSVSGSVSVSDSVSVNVSSIDDDVLYNVDKLYSIYCQNNQLVKAVLENNNFKTDQALKDRLTEFNKFLKERGQGMKKWNDYTSHFLNWHKKKPVSSSKKPTDNIQVI